MITSLKTFINRLLNNRVFCLALSYLIPLVILSYVLICLKIEPFGDKSLAVSDAIAQYIPLFSQFSRTVQDHGNMFYSFAKGLGGNYVSIIAYYLVNPFFFFFLLTDISFYTASFSYMILFQIAFSGLTMYILLTYLFGRKPHLLMFSTIYALSGYPVVYFFHVMWIQCVIALPIITLGLFELVNKRRGSVYCISMAYAIFTNFYIGFTLCFFSLFFFLTLTFYKNIRTIRVYLIYAYYSILAGLLPAFLWLPTVISLKEGRLKQAGIDDFIPRENMPFKTIAIKLFPGMNSMPEYVNGLPNIYCTLFVVFLVILFFLSRKNSKRLKISAGIILFIYVLSFYIQTFSSVFQGFSRTNWFNFRYSFCFSFILILIAAYQYQRMDEIADRDIKKALFSIVLAAILIFDQTYPAVSPALVVAELVILFVISYSYMYRRNNPEKAEYKTWVSIVSICVLISLFLNTFFDLHKIEKNMLKTSDYIKTVPAASAVIDGIKKTDASFYRMETEFRFVSLCGNDSALYGYNGFGTFTSTERQYILRGMSRFGVTWYDLKNFYDKGTPDSMESFLGLKYLISNRDLQEEKGYDLKTSLIGLNTYQNPYALGIANIANNSVTDIDYLKGNIFELQNKIWNSLTQSNKKIFKPANGVVLTRHNTMDDGENIVTSDAPNDPYYMKNPVTEAESASGADQQASDENTSDTNALDFEHYYKYSFTAPCDGPYYYFDANVISYYNGNTVDYMRYIGTYKKGDLVTGKIGSANPITSAMLKAYDKGLSFYCEDREVLKELSEIVLKRNITCENPENNRVTGTYTANDGERILLTIPYDEGWTLKIDGKPAQIDKTLGVFMSFETSAGEHEYSLEYIPTGIKCGVVISCISLFLLLLSQIILAITNLHRKKLQTDS